MRCKFRSVIKRLSLGTTLFPYTTLFRSRMDGAPLLSVQIAQDKAFTAISFGGMASHEWYDFIKNDPPLLHGIVKTDRLVVFGGGYAIKTDAGIIGGIGVSGAHYSEDMEVAQAGLDAL